MFSQMMDSLMSYSDQVSNKITPEQYQEFEHHWIIYILQEKRYGEAFCEHFKLNIHTPLYHFKDEEISRRWIKDNYLR
jgi:hypothetical protein